jgi:hypothetical protein
MLYRMYMILLCGIDGIVVDEAVLFGVYLLGVLCKTDVCLPSGPGKVITPIWDKSLFAAKEGSDYAPACEKITEAIKKSRGEGDPPSRVAR